MRVQLSTWMRTLAALVLAGVALLGTATSGAAGDAAPKLAIKGYDTVAYFVDGGPRRGDARFFVDFDERRYLFTSAAHRDQFAASPERYIPQYAGYCASAMRAGARHEADPERWLVSDGRLFIFASPRGAGSFAANLSPSITDADDHWSRMSGATGARK